MKQTLKFAAVLPVLVAVFATYVGSLNGQDKITYDDNVKPIFQQRCFSCHNANKKEGDLDLSNYTNMMLGGGSGSVVEPGDADASYLFDLVTHKQSPEMPPESDPIPAPEIETLKKWIEMGALETKSSVAKMKPKKKIEFAIADPTAGKPEVVAVPAILNLETTISARDGFTTTSIATSPWAPLAAVAGHKQVSLYNTQTLELLGVLPFPEGQVNVLRFSRNGSLLLAAGGRGGASGRGVLFDVRSGRRVAEVGDAELEAVLAADVSADHSMIAMGGPERLVRVYSTATGELMHEIKKHTEWVTAMEFSPDGILLASGDRNGGLQVWEAFTGREYLTLKAHTAMVTSVSWRSDSNMLASGSEDANIRLWELENGNQVKNWGAHGGGVTDIEFARDGRIASSGRDRVAKVWDQAGTQLLAVPAFPDISVRVSICDETNRLIAADWSGQVQVFNVAENKPLGMISANPPELKQRIETANQSLAQITAANAAAAKAATDKLAAATNAKAQLAAAQKTLAEKTERQKQLAALKTTLDAEVPKLAEQVKGMTDRIAKLESAIPLLLASKENAEKAAEQLGDEQTKLVAAEAAKVFTERNSEMTKTKTDLTAAQTTLDAKKVQLDATNKELPVVVQAMTTAKQMIDTVTPTIKPLEDQAAQAKQAADATAAQLTAATDEVTKLKNAVVFTTKFNELQTKLAAAEKVHLETFQALQQKKIDREKVQTEVNQNLALVNTATTNLGNAQKLLDEKNALLVAAQKVKTDNDGKIAALNNETNQLNAQIPMLDEVVAKLQAIVTASPNDKEVADQMAATKGIADRRKQRVVEIAKLVEAAKAEIPKLDAAIVAATAEVEKQKANVAVVQKTLTDAQAKHAESVKVLQTHDPLVQAAQQATDQANVAVEAIKKEIAALQGL